MPILSKQKIEERLDKKDLVVTPILDADQIGDCTIDLRLGTHFKVDLKTREPFVDPVASDRPIGTFFEETYREFGERFLLYPGQLVVASTFEYVQLPKDTAGLLMTRSSWNRLGLKISSLVHPGYSGVLTLELMNTSSNPIALYPGLRFVQMLLVGIDNSPESESLPHTLAKYVANVAPHVSQISEDREIRIIKKFKSILPSHLLDE